MQLHIGENLDSTQCFCGLLDGVRFSSGIYTSFPYAGLASITPEPELSAGSECTPLSFPTPTPGPTSTPAPTATPTPVFGGGNDGDLVVASGQTLTTDNTRSALAFSAASGQRSLTLANAAGFTIGQEVLIIEMQGVSVGGYEFAYLTGISGNTLTLQTDLTRNYAVEAFPEHRSSACRIIKM